MDHRDHDHTEGTMNPRLPPDMLQAPPSYVITGRIMLLAILISSILLLLFFIAYIALRRHNTRPARLHFRPHRLTFSSCAESSPRRLDRSVMDSIPVIQLSLQGDGATESCAVCISEFTHGEKVKVLPQCRHRFHLECIDMWFGSHSTCPLCRCDINLTAKSDSVELEVTHSQNKEAHTIMDVVVHRDRGGDHCSAEEMPQLPQVNNCSHDDSNSVVHPSALDHMV